MSALLVVAQFLLIILIVQPSVPVSFNLPTTIGFVLAVSAGVLAVSALMAMRMKNFSVMPRPVQNGELCESGPYRYIRHPMYSAVILGSCGLCVVYQSASKWFLLITLILVLVAKIYREEKFLRAAYPGYVRYASRTKILVPFIL